MKKAKVEDNASQLSIDAAYKSLNLDKLIATEKISGLSSTLNATKNFVQQKAKVEDNASQLSIDAAYKSLNLDKLIATEKISGLSSTLKSTINFEQ